MIHQLFFCFVNIILFIIFIYYFLSNVEGHFN